MRRLGDFLRVDIFIPLSQFSGPPVGFGLGSEVVILVKAVAAIAGGVYYIGGKSFHSRFLS